jgi:protein-arginine kinase activator protein McsA
MFCPLTGKPCSKAKNIEVGEVINGQQSCMILCDDCFASIKPTTHGCVVEPSDNFDPEIKFPSENVMPPPFSKTGNLPASMLGLSSVPMPSQLTGPLAYFAKLVEQIEKHQQPENPLLVQCPGCGLTLTDIHKLGRLGCSHCYVFFKQQISPLLKHVQEGKDEHVGKIPHKHNHQEEAAFKAEQVVMIQSSLAVLEKKLTSAVAKEKYEDAGKIRDQIKYLKVNV